MWIVKVPLCFFFLLYSRYIRVTPGSMKDCAETHNTKDEKKKEKRAKCMTRCVCMCTVVYLGANGGLYNIMFQNPGRDVGGSSIEINFSCCCSFTSSMCFLFLSANPLHLFFSYFLPSVAKTHTHKLHLILFVVFVFVLCLFFFIDYILYILEEMYKIYTSSPSSSSSSSTSSITRSSVAL